MNKYLLCSLVAFWLFLGFFFYSGWIAIWGDDIGSIGVFCLLWSAGLLGLTEPKQSSTMEHDS